MNARVRDRYMGDTVQTASPARLLVMLYDRLLLDLQTAESAIADRQIELASNSLTHAQDIVMELRLTLDTEAWAGAPALAQLYSFLVRELIDANVRKDAAKVVACREIVEPLRETWIQAASNLAAA